MDLRTVTAFFLNKARLLRRIEALEAETADVRARLIAAQNAKATAENQAEELRSDKERLRTRINDLKKAADQDRRVTEQLRGKFEELQEELARIKATERKP